MPKAEVLFCPCPKGSFEPTVANAPQVGVVSKSVNVAAVVVAVGLLDFSRVWMEPASRSRSPHHQRPKTDRYFLGFAVGGADVGEQNLGVLFKV